MSFAKNVSVVVCVKNVEKIIEPCIKSVLENNPKEIIVIDGQSHDRTKEIAELFNAKVFSDEGKGLSYARRLGVIKSQGEYVLFLGPDNIIKPNFIDDFVKNLTDWNFDVATTFTRVKSPIGYWDKGLDCRWRLLMSSPGPRKVIGTPGLYKRKCFEKINFSKQDLGPCDDTLFSDRLLKLDYKLGLVPITLYDQNGSTAASTWERYKWYGSGDNAFFNYNSISWSVKRKLKSILHPLNQTLNYSSKVVFTSDFPYLGWLFFTMIARYYGWINSIFKINIKIKEG